jgi:hypothetical protein
MIKPSTTSLEQSGAQATNLDLRFVCSILVITSIDEEELRSKNLILEVRMFSLQYYVALSFYDIRIRIS